MPDNEIVEFQERAFDGHSESKLQYIDFDNLTHLRSIQKYAFRYLDDLNLTAIPAPVVYIGTEAMNGSFERRGSIKTFTIAGSVTKMDSRAFAYCDIPIETLYIGGPGDPTQLDISGWNTSKAPYFTQNPHYRPKTLYIYCEPERMQEFENAMQNFADEGKAIFEIAWDVGGDEPLGQYFVKSANDYT